MKCNEFKNLLQTGKEVSDNNLEQHLNKCSECSEWLDNFLKEPPKEITTSMWQTPTVKCMPNTDQLIVKEKELSLFGSFKSGIKYGLVFGVVILLMLSIFNPGQTKINLAKYNYLLQNISNSDSNIQAFYKVENNLFKSKYFFVTNDVTTDTNIANFVKEEHIPSFYEVTPEETKWYESI